MENLYTSLRKPAAATEEEEQGLHLFMHSICFSPGILFVNLNTVDKKETSPSDLSKSYMGLRVIFCGSVLKTEQCCSASADELTLRWVAMRMHSFVCLQHAMQCKLYRMAYDRFPRLFLW